MLPAWVPDRPVNFSQDVSVMHKQMRCQLGPRCLPAPHWGSWERLSETPAPFPPHQPGLCPACSEEKSHVRPREGVVRTSLSSFCPHSCCHPVHVGVGRNGSGRKAVGGEEEQGRGLLPTARTPCHWLVWDDEDAHHSVRAGCSHLHGPGGG